MQGDLHLLHAFSPTRHKPGEGEVLGEVDEDRFKNEKYDVLILLEQRVGTWLRIMDFFYFAPQHARRETNIS